MGTTPLHNLPYPEGTDQPYVHLDIQALADAIDPEFSITQETAPAHKAGRRWFQPSTRSTKISDGSDWVNVKRWDGGGITVMADASGIITVPHSLGVTPYFYSAVTRIPGSTVGVQQVAIVLPNSASATNVTFLIRRSDTGVVLPGQIGVMWSASVD